MEAHVVCWPQLKDTAVATHFSLVLNDKFHYIYPSHVF